jgi:uncharacterized protein (DUF1499 family)
MTRAESGAGRWAFLVAVGAALVFVGGPLLAHVRLLSPLRGFVLFDLGGLLGLAALLLGITATLRGRESRRGLVLGGVMTLAFLLIAARGVNVPRINDITTDVVNPPQFVTAGSLDGNRGRDMRYPGASFAQQQQAGYPNLGPLALNVPVDEAFKRVLAAAAQMPMWEITRSDTGAHALEGVATSRVFRFQDDFVIEVRPHDGGSLVQMRSKSRDGKGDIGANAARIEAFFAKLRS